MPKKKKAVNLYSLHLPVIVLAVAIVGFAVLFGTTYRKSNILGSKSSSNSNKSVKNVQPTTSKGQLHKKIMTKMVDTLETVAQTEEGAGNTGVSDEVAEVAETEDETAAETAEAIDGVESKPKWQVALFGPSYKNLGQLRSSLAHNTNDVRKLNKALETATTPESATAIQTQLSVLQLARQQIVGVIETNESQFSLLGWMVRLINGYKPFEGALEPVVTPTPTPSSTPELTPTPEPSAAPTPEPSATPEPTPEPSPTP